MALAYWPAAQLLQTVEAAEPAQVPGLQRMQVVTAPDMEYFPSTQSEQEVVPLVTLVLVN